MEPFPDGSEVHAGDRRPFNEGPRNAMTGNPAIVTTIKPLVLTQGPSAIVWAIIAVIVFAVNAVFIGRASAHVGDEVGERISPSLANSNPPASVVSVTLGVRVVAAVNHAVPNAVLFGLPQPMPPKVGAPFSVSNASAACAVAALEIAGSHKSGSATITAAEPNGVFMLSESVVRYDGQLLEPLPREVAKSGASMITSSHDVNSLNEFAYGQGRHGVSRTCRPACIIGAF